MEPNTINKKIPTRIQVTFLFLDWSVAEVLVGGSVVGSEVTGAAVEIQE